MVIMPYGRRRSQGSVVNYIPELRRLPPSEIIHVFTATPAHLGFEEYDVTNQIAASHHYWVMDHQLKTLSSPHRYVRPSDWTSWRGWPEWPSASGGVAGIGKPSGARAAATSRFGRSGVPKSPEQEPPIGGSQRSR